MSALLVSIGAPCLRRIGLAVPERDIASPERHFYDVLAESDSDSAHSRAVAWDGRPEIAWLTRVR